MRKKSVAARFFRVMLFVERHIMRHIEVLFRDSGASKIAVVKGKSTIRELLVSISSEAAYYERHQIMLDKKPANFTCFNQSSISLARSGFSVSNCGCSDDCFINYFWLLRNSTLFS